MFLEPKLAIADLTETATSQPNSLTILLALLLKDPCG